MKLLNTNYNKNFPWSYFFEVLSLKQQADQAPQAHDVLPYEPAFIPVVFMTFCG
jgi:hypothetical protein